MAEEQAQPQPSVPQSSTSGQSSSNPQAMDTSGLHGSQHLASQILPPMHSSAMERAQKQEQNGHGQGLYAVQFSPFMGMMPEYPPSMLIPLTYKIPMRTNSTGAAGEEQRQGGDAVRQQRGQQRQVLHVRRFQLAFQLDLALLMKLAFAVILFGQDGSRKRTVILVLLATLVYLYQTGVLTPLIRYARRGLAPPRPVVRPQNADARQNDGNAGVDNPNHGNQNQQPAEANQPPPEPEPPVLERGNGMNLWGIVREIQTFVIGFITSLLPGFEQHD